MSYSFGQFEKDYFSEKNENDSEDFVDNLSPVQINDLQNELANAPDETFNKVHDILSDYAGVEGVKNSVIKEILKKNLLLSMEVFSGGIGDTCQRGLLIDAFIKHYGFQSWPTYGWEKLKKDEFYKKYEEEMIKQGFTVL